MKAIVMSFSLRGQSHKAIIEKLKEVRKHSGPALLIHGNIPTTEVRKRHNAKSSPINDALDELFPIQLRLWNGKTLRKEMAEYGKKFNAEAVVIGSASTEGVSTEVVEYTKQGLHITYYPIL